MILINNFPQPFTKLGLESQSKYNQDSFIFGFQLFNADPHKIPIELKCKYISDILNSLLIHDQIVIRTVNALDLLSLFDNSNDFLELIKSDCINFIDDYNTYSGILKSNNLSGVSIARLCSPISNDKQKTTIEFLDEKIKINGVNFRNKKDSDFIKNALLINIEKKNKAVPQYDFFSNQIIQELEYDFKNKNLLQELKIKSTNIYKIKEDDIFKVNRLLELNKALLLADQLKIDNILLDGGIKNILPKKFPPLLAKQFDKNINLLFQDVCNKKQIPDIGRLFYEKIITIDDFLKFRQSKPGRTFRKWLSNTNYDQIKIEHDLLQSTNLNENKIVKLLRFVIPIAIGILNAPAGIIASAANSYLIDKFIKEWHPNLFLDEYLKIKIDNKIKEYDNDNIKKSIEKRIPQIGRNQLCPCDSGKKYKNCCGKN